MDRRADDGLAAMREKVEAAEAVVIKLKLTANAYAEVMQLEPPYPEAASPEAPAAGRLNIRADQFTAHAAPSTAARAFLEWRGRERGAVTIEQLYEALVAGGYRFDSKDDASRIGGLRIALGKDHLIERLPNNHYGLTAWYGRKTEPRKAKSASTGAEHISSDTAQNEGSEEAASAEPTK